MEDAKARAAHAVTRLGMELALAINDYNSEITDALDEVIKLTLAYLAAVKEALTLEVIQSRDLNSYFALVGQSWGSIRPRFSNEYLPGEESRGTEGSS
jgi:hypothetical protein